MSAAAAAIHPYASPLYARALSGAGRPVEVDAWASFVLARALPDGTGEDAMGAYPMAAFAQDADLEAGLEALRAAGLVSLVLVPDPLSGPGPAALAAAFELDRPFKTHQLVDPARGPFEPSKHHRDRIRRGGRRCRIERTRLAPHLDRWLELYQGLVERRAVTGLAAFDPHYFRCLAELPQLEAFTAHVDDRLCAMTLWFAHGGVAYNHLTASDEVGYANGAAFALYAAAIEHFEGEVINLGGGAGWRDDPDDGLAAFKRGFANAEVLARLCGAILDRQRYQALSAGRSADGFFPAYRA